MMIRKTGFYIALYGLLGLGVAQGADDLQKMQPEVSQLYAQHLSDLFKKEHPDLPSKIEVDPSQASGVLSGQDGIICVPAKDLKEGNIDPAVESEAGAGLCYLFLSPCFAPLKDGKPVDSQKLRRIKFDNGQGQEREAICILVTVKHLGGDDWRLYGFGTEKTPIVNSQFEDASSGADKSLAFKVSGSKDMKANLELILLSKYSSSFAIASK
jgi:hypothetical protein